MAKIELESYEFSIKKVNINGQETEVAQLKNGFNEEFIAMLREKGVKNYVSQEEREMAKQSAEENPNF